MHVCISVFFVILNQVGHMAGVGKEVEVMTYGKQNEEKVGTAEPVIPGDGQIVIFCQVLDPNIQCL